VRRIAGAQVCFDCAKHLPGHLLRKVFPTLESRGLREFMAENQIVGMTNVDRPEADPPAAVEKLPWTKSVARKFGGFCRAIARKFGRSG
jgi:hypothetical protein